MVVSWTAMWGIIKVFWPECITDMSLYKKEEMNYENWYKLIKVSIPLISGTQLGDEVMNPIFYPYILYVISIALSMMNHWRNKCLPALRVWGRQRGMCWILPKRTGRPFAKISSPAAFSEPVAPPC